MSSDVAFWPEADVIIAPKNVRFWGVERTCADHPAMSPFDPNRSFNKRYPRQANWPGEIMQL
jgi:hypothetical protein